MYKHQGQRIIMYQREYRKNLSDPHTTLSGAGSHLYQMIYPAESRNLRVLLKLWTELYHYHLLDPVLMDNHSTCDKSDHTKSIILSYETLSWMVLTEHRESWVSLGA